MTTDAQEQLLAELDWFYDVEWELVTDDGAHVAFGEQRSPTVIFWVCDTEGAATRILRFGGEFTRFAPVRLAPGNTLTTTLVD